VRLIGNLNPSADRGSWNPPFSIQPTLLFMYASGVHEEEPHTKAASRGVDFLLFLRSTDFL